MVHNGTTGRAVAGWWLEAAWGQLGILATGPAGERGQERPAGETRWWEEFHGWLKMVVACGYYPVVVRVFD